MGHKLTVEPEIEPIDLDDVKEYARLDANVTAFDTALLAHITEGRVRGEEYQARAYITQTWELWLDAWPDFPFDVPHPPLQSVDTIEYYGTDDTKYTLDEDDYFVDTVTQPGRVGLNYNVSLPNTTLRPTNAVCVTYTAGYGDDCSDVPETIKGAIRLFALWRFENPEVGDAPVAFYRALMPQRIVRL